MAFDKKKIEELYPGAIMYEAQLINKGSDSLLKAACDSGEYFGQLKKDGFWYQCELHKSGDYLFSRSASRTTGLQAEKSANVPHIMQALSCLPKETILVGEIYYPGGSSKNTTEIMGCLPTKALERQNGKYGKIHYYIHDILMYDGVNFIEAKTGNWDRYRILQKIWEKHNLNSCEYLELAAAWTDELYSRVGDALADGEEGMVVKKKDAPYEPGKRPTSNLKAKKVDFADVVIMGFEAPTEEYYGKEIESWQYWEHYGYDDIEYNGLCKGSYYSEYVKDKTRLRPVTKPYFMGWYNARIKIGLYKDSSLVEVGVIHSGISDEMKKDMSEHPENYLNHVCAIQMMEVDNVGKSVRHGFFKGMRPDKNPSECKFEDVFGQK